jgi:hypothetical protein
MDPEDGSAAREVLLDTAARCIDELGRPRAPRIPDVDHQQAACPWAGETSLDILDDLDCVSEILNDAGDPPRRCGKGMPWIRVRAAAAYQYDISHHSAPRSGEVHYVPGTQLARIVVQHGVKQLIEHRNREA